MGQNTIHEDVHQFIGISMVQIQSYTGAASFAGYSTSGVAAYRNLPATPTLTQLTDFVKTLAHDLFAPKS